MRTIGAGARGDDVRDVQSRLAALGFPIEPEEHGTFGESTVAAVREFQQRRQLLVDGRVGEDTWHELVEAGRTLGDNVLYLRYPSFRGDDVRALQGRLNLIGFDAGREDGIFGQRTDMAVREFQRNVGLVPDGIVGPVTLDALLRIRPVGAGPGRAMVREAEAMSRMEATLEGACIAIDAGHGAGDTGSVGQGGLAEAEATSMLAEALAAELTSRGAEPFLLRERGAGPSVAERARAANDRGAEVLISLHLNAHDDPKAEGALTFYYGRGDYVSKAGQRLAELIQDEMTSSMGLKDGRTHPKSLPMLRETRMPAVHVEPCFITNPAEEAKLRREEFRTGIAAAVRTALERFFRASHPTSAPAVGTLGLSQERPLAPTDLVPSGSAAGGTPSEPTEDEPEQGAEGRASGGS
jgi:N-acetylmuramoyl-L-alanine amidase